MLVDLEGLGVRHMWRPGVQALLRIIETVEVSLFELSKKKSLPPELLESLSRNNEQRFDHSRAQNVSRSLDSYFSFHRRKYPEEVHDQQQRKCKG